MMCRHCGEYAAADYIRPFADLPGNANWCGLRAAALRAGSLGVCHIGATGFFGALATVIQKS